MLYRDMKGEGNGHWLKKPALQRRVSAKNIPETLLKKVVGCAECHMGPGRAGDVVSDVHSIPLVADIIDAETGWLQRSCGGNAGTGYGPDIIEVEE